MIVVGHPNTDDREHLGKFATLLIEGQPFQFVRFTRVYSAVQPQKAKRVWWDQLREQADDRRIHMLN